MKISVASFEEIESRKQNLLAVGLFEDEAKISGKAAQLDTALGGIIGRILSNKEFQAKLGKTFLLYSLNPNTQRVLLVGMGKRRELNLEAIRHASGKVAIQVRDLGLISYELFAFENNFQEKESLGRAIAEGTILALYTFNRYKTDKDKIPKEVKSMTILAPKKEDIQHVVNGVKQAEAVCEATYLARDLANTPSSDLTPSKLAGAAKKIAEQNGLKIRIIERNEMEKFGMGGILGVARGSTQPPKLVVMEYYGGRKDEKPIALVGKAITFDSGGISIKPAEHMEEMKFDKSGGATVLATMLAIAKLKLPVNVVCIVPSAENLPSGTAYKPGDILKFYGGKTAEIINTDAEGRLILADALAYAVDVYKPQAIIDLATLTGACVIALGSQASGLLTNNETLAREIFEAGESSGERVWQLPLWKEYSDLIKSEVADIKNVGGRSAGAITAAAFLSNFVGGQPWAHLDIAGTAWTQEGSPEKSYTPKGATGVGVRLLVEFLRNHK